MSPLQGISRLLASRTPTWEQTIEEPTISEQHQQLHEIWTNNRWTNINSRRTNNRWTKLTTSLLVKLEETFSQSCCIYAKKSLSYQLNLPEESAKVTHWKNCIENGGSSERVWELEGDGGRTPSSPDQACWFDWYSYDTKLHAMTESHITAQWLLIQYYYRNRNDFPRKHSSALSELKFRRSTIKHSWIRPWHNERSPTHVYKNFSKFKSTLKGPIEVGVNWLHIFHG